MRRMLCVSALASKIYVASVCAVSVDIDLLDATRDEQVLTPEYRYKRCLTRSVLI